MTDFQMISLLVNLLTLLICWRIERLRQRAIVKIASDRILTGAQIIDLLNAAQAGRGGQQ